MALNQGQQDAFIDVIGLINDPDRKYHFITGGAGSGKTFTIATIAGGILDHKPVNSPLHSVQITATTNKAKAVISEALPNRAMDIMTIYSFMNLRVKENYSNGTSKCVPTAKWQIHSGVLLIIDECSMIDKNLMKFIEEGTDNTCKVIFVGDKNQLSPIKENLSKVFTQGYSSSELTQSVRNAEQPALMNLCEQMKQTVETGIFTKIRSVPGVVINVDGAELQGVLERGFHKEDSAKRVLAYTNNRVVQYNEFIRSLRGYTQPFEIGEILTNNTSAELMTKERLYTDQMVEVVAIESQHSDETIIKGHEIDMITLVVRDVMTFAHYTVTTFAYPEDRVNVLKFHAGRKDWQPYFKVKNNFPDLRSVASSTIHKAQGSTYDVVVVDLEDIGKCTDKAQTARMQYVALSRPKQRVYIRGELPERYFE